MNEQLRNLTLEEMDQLSLMHPVASIADNLAKAPMILKNGSGVRLTDNKGQSFIDGSAGLWCVNIGYGREVVARAAYEEMQRMGYYHTFGNASNEPHIRLADRVLRLLQENGAPEMSRVFYGLSGSDANDSQMKLVRYYNNARGKPEKKKIISRQGAYHGLTLAAGSLTGIPFYHKLFDLPIDGVLHTTCPHHYHYAEEGESEEDFATRLAAELEELILREGPDTIAAFIAEPIMGTGGVLVPPKGYFEQIQAVLDRHDVLFIADEVICGFGRLGEWFGTTHFNLQPDLVTMAKGLTSAYFPMSAIAIGEKVWKVLGDASTEAGPVPHGFTYSGHPVGGAVGMAVLDVMEEENLVANAKSVGAYFMDQLRDRFGEHPYVGEIRGEGLMIALEFMQDRAKKQPFANELAVHRKVQAAGFEHGLLVRALPWGAVVAFSPPLGITKAEVDETVELTAKSIDQAFASLT